MHRGEITANGLRFAYLEAGDGPLVLLLHGFPDNAHTWEQQMPALAAAGYRPEQISDVLRGMGGGVITAEAKVAGPGDPECGTRAGYVRGYRAPIVLCAAFFASSSSARRAAWVMAAASTSPRSLR